MSRSSPLGFGGQAQVVAPGAALECSAADSSGGCSRSRHAGWATASIRFHLKTIHPPARLPTSRSPPHRRSRCAACLCARRRGGDVRVRERADRCHRCGRSVRSGPSIGRGPAHRAAACPREDVSCRPRRADGAVLCRDHARRTLGRGCASRARRPWSRRRRSDTTARGSTRSRRPPTWSTSGPRSVTRKRSWRSSSTCRRRSPSWPHAAWTGRSSSTSPSRTATATTSSI